MTQDPQKNSRVGGGGAATSAGVIFQQRLGSFIATQILSDDPFDPVFNLGEAKPSWIRFETEAPVDDILVATNLGGFVAIQAKTTASLSRGLNSPFGKSVSQFVRHWLACEDGDGAKYWNRSLSSELDRLVLAVGPESSARIRIDLSNALRLISQPGGGELNQAQTEAFDIFFECVKSAWIASTTKPFNDSFPQKIAQFIVIAVFDTEGTDRQLAIHRLQKAAAKDFSAETVMNSLDSFIADLMMSRGGADSKKLRKELIGYGARLAAPPNYIHDVEKLKKHSLETAKALDRYEVIEATDGNRVTIQRDCQPLIEAATKDGSLLVVGEPGSGKSGVLNALARKLRGDGHDVLELAVDRFSVESLEGLSRELDLEHSVLEVLNAWDGSGTAWLIVDALDATRGGAGESVFRHLIERVLQRNGRWRVVASIRTFDLRMGQQFRSLFRGSPPIEDLKESGFPNVRHVRVPEWSDAEFQQLMEAAPALETALRNASQTLKDLAVVPFNTRLLSELTKDGLVGNDFFHVSSQAQLLQLYWEHRIERHGIRGRTCIARIANAMVSARTLRARVDDAAGSDPEIVDVLAREGVIISVDNGRWIQFRHHLLFDFSAAKVLIDPSDLIDGTLHFPKAQTQGLMLAPALSFVLREIWDNDDSRARFWSAATNTLADNDADPVLRSAVGRIAAEYPELSNDTSILAQRIAAADTKASASLSHICGAVAVRLEDDPNAPVAPWAALLEGVSIDLSQVAGSVRFLAFTLLRLELNEAELTQIGACARALLHHSFALSEPNNLVISAIDLVATTFETDPSTARSLLLKVFEPARFDSHGWEEVPAVCRKIEKIAPIDPEFATTIYERTYGFSVTEEHQTRLGDSKILSLTSNARQDYDMARYSLTEYAPTFLARFPREATMAIVKATEGFILREHPPSSDLSTFQMDVDGRQIFLQEDYSHIWAYDPETAYGHDADALVVKLLELLRSASQETATDIVELVADQSRIALLWSRIFLAASERKDSLVDLLMPIAMSGPFLLAADTRKDAIDLVAAGYARLKLEDKISFEKGVDRLDFSRYLDPPAAREHFVQRLYTAIGDDLLATEVAKRWIASVDNDVDTGNNRRLFSVTVGTGEAEPYHWIGDLDRHSESDQELMQEISAAKEALGLEASDESENPPSLDTSLDALVALRTVVGGPDRNEGLVSHAEGVIGLGIRNLIKSKTVPGKDDVVNTERFLDLVLTTVRSASPSVEEETEADFERFASWGSPAARVEIASGILDLMLQRPDLYPEVTTAIDELIADPHPAVRLQSGLHLVRLWDLDRSGFWSRLEDRLQKERNLSVLNSLVSSVIGRLIHSDPDRASTLAVCLTRRFSEDPERQAKLDEALASVLTVLWITYEKESAWEVISDWIDNRRSRTDELIDVLQTMRGALVLGFGDSVRPGDDDTRRRAIDLTSHILAKACGGLEAHFAQGVTYEEQLSTARNDAKLVDTACMQIYFAVGASDCKKAENSVFNEVDLRKFFEEITPQLETIGKCGTPHTIYYLSQLLQFLLPIDPPRSFDLLALALKEGGRRTGYQYESMGAELLVKLLGIFLADHKELFDAEDRRSALIDCLEIFMEAGWPAARRLLYRLPELLQ
ncbi:ATP-binding protein [Paracoccus caeni]|uniref:ATP-binding protein n=1 Tax=Paracoccus caeni TaxID=657651 RepID=A0A934SFQ3_9RHOB|nr:ATP-binding protein [Paracoccus caeni]MBK4216161.1 ATP-binding protein [Paracoccus caeni]